MFCRFSFRFSLARPLQPPSVISLKPNMLPPQGSRFSTAVSRKSCEGKLGDNGRTCRRKGRQQKINEYHESSTPASNGVLNDLPKAPQRAMKRGDPAWIGCIYALSIFTGVSLGVLSESSVFPECYAGRKYVKQLHGLWSAPFRITVAMVLLYQKLGVASGSMMLILMIPIQTIVISKIRKLAKDGLQQTDKRVGLVNEILAAMDNVKYDSTPPTVIVSNITENKMFQNSIPVVVTLTSLGMFTFLGGNLTPARAFTWLSLFAVLCCMLSIKHVEQHPSRFLPAEKPTLSNIKLEIPVGSLVAVVGGTGEGKTSLVSAMLGKLPPRADSGVVIRGTVAYVPQVSWIFNATTCGSQHLFFECLQCLILAF
ncbi:unnamed protein product [Prunus armeniaca]